MERYPKITLKDIKGLNDSLLKPNKPIDFSDEAKNIYFPLSGGIKTLNGRSQYNSTAIGKILAIGILGNETLVADGNGNIYKIDGTGGFISLATGKATTNIYDTIVFNKRLYFFNGVDTPFYYDGLNIVETGLNAGKYVEVLWDRLVYAGVEGTEDTVYLSGVYDDTFTDQAYSFPAPVTGLATIYNNLVVFTEDTIYLLVPYGDIFRVEKLESSVGCVGNGTIQKVEGSIIFLSKKGFYILQGTNPVPLSVGYLDENFKNFSLNNAANFVSCLDTENFLYWCSITTGGASENDKTFMCNYLTKNWSYLDIGYSYLEKNDVLLAGSSDGYLYQENLFGAMDRDGEWRSGWLRGGSLSDLIRWNFLYVYLSGVSAQTSLSVSFGKDWATTVFKTIVKDLTPTGAIWGNFVWGEATWGASADITVLRIPINVVSRSLSVGIIGKNFYISNIEISYKPLGGGL